MRHLTKTIILALLVCACNSETKNAQTMLRQAQYLYENSKYEQAKAVADSIKILYPKNGAVLKKNLQLLRQIEIKETEKTVILCDSLLPLRETEFESMKSGFIYEKNEEYDEAGKYFEKSQKIENKLQRSYLRCNTNENGEFFLASVYYGNAPINHSSLKASLADGTAAETETVPFDGGLNYRFKDLGMTTEVVTYQKDKGLGVAMLIYNNSKQNIKLEYLGGKRFTTTVSQADKNSVVKTVELASLIAEINKIKNEREKATKRLEYLYSKQAN
jgi:tetratricopeptide (TPR) repeat protein